MWSTGVVCTDGGQMSRYPARKQPAYGGASRPCARHSPASRRRCRRGSRPGRRCRRVRDAGDAAGRAPTSGAASSACSWTSRSGPQSRASGSRSATIGGVSASPNIRGNTNAGRAGRREAPPPRSHAPRSAASSAPLAPAATASMPAAVTSGVACAAVAHRTSWPAARNARASWSMGMTWPWPEVDENRTRMAWHAGLCQGACGRST